MDSRRWSCKYRTDVVCCSLPKDLSTILSFFLRLHNRFQLPSVPERILNDLIARNENILVVCLLLLREIYPAILDKPARLLGKLDDTTFGIEKEERLGVGDGDGGVSFFGARGNFFANGTDENLSWWISIILQNTDKMKI